MMELRAAKLVSATLLICTGAVCVAIGELLANVRNAGTFVGLALLIIGIPILIRQWSGQGPYAHVRNAWRRILWTPWLVRERIRKEEPREFEAHSR
jgi:hypothetical protein